MKFTSPARNRASINFVSPPIEVEVKPPLSIRGHQLSHGRGYRPPPIAVGGLELLFGLSEFFQELATVESLTPRLITRRDARRGVKLSTVRQFLMEYNELFEIFGFSDCDAGG